MHTTLHIGFTRALVERLLGGRRAVVTGDVGEHVTAVNGEVCGNGEVRGNGEVYEDGKGNVFYNHLERDIKDL